MGALEILENAQPPTTMAPMFLRGSGPLHLPWGSARVIPVLFGTLR